MYSIHPLSQLLLGQTLSLAARCFPDDSGYRWALPLCVADDSLAALWKEQTGLLEARQWVLVDNATRRVIGTYGLYASVEDLEPANRFSVFHWFCVDPEFRGAGIGGRLWQSALSECKGLGRKLIFYSSDEPGYREAGRFYLHAGCTCIVGPALPGGPHHLTYYYAPPSVSTPDEATLARIESSLWQHYSVDENPALARGIPLPQAA